MSSLGGGPSLLTLARAAGATPQASTRGETPKESQGAAYESWVRQQVLRFVSSASFSNLAKNQGIPLDEQGSPSPRIVEKLVELAKEDPQLRRVYIKQRQVESRAAGEVDLIGPEISENRGSISIAGVDAIISALAARLLSALPVKEKVQERNRAAAELKAGMGFSPFRSSSASSAGGANLPTGFSMAASSSGPAGAMTGYGLGRTPQMRAAMKRASKAAAVYASDKAAQKQFVERAEGLAIAGSTMSVTDKEARQMDTLIRKTTNLSRAFYTSAGGAGHAAAKAGLSAAQSRAVGTIFKIMQQRSHRRGQAYKREFLQQVMSQGQTLAANPLGFSSDAVLLAGFLV